MAEDSERAATGAQPEARPRRFLAAASWPRALIETLALGAIFAVSLPLYPGRNTPTSHLLAFMLLIGPAGCTLWMALRLRLPAMSWRRALLIEAPVGLLLSAPASATLLFILLRDYIPFRPARQEQYLILLGVILLLFALAFVVYRFGVRLWLWWDIKRRRSLRWALTHALLSVAASGVFIVSLALFGLQIAFFRPDAPLFQWLTAIVVISILLIIGILVALPPSALFSFLFARGAARRILDLAHATERLRAGDLAARAPVQGEDEVAQLQMNFNAMAADMERGVHDLRAERDQVALLLDQRRELIANVSHELRTPVATLRGYLESATLRWNEATPDALRHDVDVMLHETQRLQSLIDDLFTLAQAQVGRLDLHCAPTDLGALARGVVETMAPLAWRGGRVEVVARIAPALPAAQIDATRTEQALHNLLRNAMRHTAPGGIIAVVAEQSGERLALRVRDTGEGISQDELPRIWERFYRSDRARAADASGSGLGLALVKEVVEGMGGAVEVESALGEGSVFTLLLPLAAEDALPIASPSLAATV